MTKVVHCKAICKHMKDFKCTLEEISIEDWTIKYDNEGVKYKEIGDTQAGSCNKYEWIQE